MKKFLMILMLIGVASSINYTVNTTNTTYTNFTVGDCIIDGMSGNTYCPTEPDLALNITLWANSTYYNSQYNITFTALGNLTVVENITVVQNITNITTCENTTLNLIANSSGFANNVNVSCTYSISPVNYTVYANNTIEDWFGTISCLADNPPVVIEQNVINISECDIGNLTLWANSSYAYQWGNISCLYNQTSYCGVSETIVPNNSIQRIKNESIGLDILVEQIPNDWCFENRYEEATEMKIFRSDISNNTFICNPEKTQEVNISELLNLTKPTCEEQKVFYTMSSDDQNITCDNPIRINACPEQVNSPEEANALLRGNITEFCNIKTIQYKNTIESLNKSLAEAKDSLNLTVNRIEQIKDDQTVAIPYFNMIGFAMIGIALVYYYFKNNKRFKDVVGLRDDNEKIKQFRMKFDETVKRKLGGGSNA